MCVLGGGGLKVTLPGWTELVGQKCPPWSTEWVGQKCPPCPGHFNKKVDQFDWSEVSSLVTLPWVDIIGQECPSLLVYQGQPIGTDWSTKGPFLVGLVGKKDWVGPNYM